MKIHELAKELDIDAKEVLEKAQAMGIEAKDKNSTLEDMDAKAVRNTVLKNKGGAETKIVKAAPKKKAEKSNDKKSNTSEPKVTVKAAKIAIPVQSKSPKHRPAKQQEKTAIQKPPAGKPVVSKELENRPKPPVGKPVVSKELQDRGKKVQEEPKAAPAKVQETASEKKTQTAAPEKKPQTAAQTAKNGQKPVIRQERLKIIKKAAEVHEEERLAREKREKAAAARAAEKKNEKRSDDRASRRDNRDNRERDNGRDRKKDGNKGQRRDHNQGGRPARKEALEPIMEKPSSHKKAERMSKDKERDKFAKLERGGKKGGKPQPTRSLEKKVRPKKQNKPKPAPEPEVETVELPAGTIVINVPITVAGLSEQIQVSVSQIIMTLMKMGVMASSYHFLLRTRDRKRK